MNSEKEGSKNWQPRPGVCFLAGEIARKAAANIGRDVGGKKSPLDCIECGKETRSFIHCVICGYYACEDCVFARPGGCAGCIAVAKAKKGKK